MKKVVDQSTCVDHPHLTKYFTIDAAATAYELPYLKREDVITALLEDSRRGLYRGAHATACKLKKKPRCRARCAQARSRG